MSIFNDKALKGVAEAVSKIVDEELKGNQHKIDANKNGKVDAHDFKLLRAKKGMKEELKQVDEAFPTVADAKKRMAAGKTTTGTVTKTKTGLVHKRDYKDDEDDAEDMQKKPKGYGARQNFKRSTRVNEQKLSFVEMLQLYNESGVEVIAKIAPKTVKFGDTEVELIDANEVNGVVGITVAEEVDNETFTKEVEAQKEKNAGRGKKAEVAKASVQAVKQEEVELEEGDTPYNDQLSLRGVTAPGAPMSNRHGYKKAGTGTYLGGNKPRKATVAKATDALKTNIKNSLGKHPKPNLPEEVELDESHKVGDSVIVNSKFFGKQKGKVVKVDKQSVHVQRNDKKYSEKYPHDSVMKEEVEELDELKKSTVASYIQKKFGKMSDEPVSKNQYGYAKKDAKGIQRAGLRMSGIKATQKEEVEQIDEISKSTLGSYIKKASHDVAAKGAFTRHFADKSRAETAAQRPDLARLTMKKADKMQDAGMKRRANMAKAVDRLTKEDVQMDERTLTSAETKEKEKNVKGMKKSLSGFKSRYGDDAKSVMYATATKMAKKD